jgi:hypothetical protein
MDIPSGRVKRARRTRSVRRRREPPSSPGESHPEALTDPYVRLSPHTARVIRLEATASRHYRVPPVSR